MMRIRKKNDEKEKNNRHFSIKNIYTTTQHTRCYLFRKKIAVAIGGKEENSSNRVYAKREKRKRANH